MSFFLKMCSGLVRIFILEIRSEIPPENSSGKSFLNSSIQTNNQTILSRFLQDFVQNSFKKPSRTRDLFRNHSGGSIRNSRLIVESLQKLIQKILQEFLRRFFHYYLKRFWQEFLQRFLQWLTQIPSEFPSDQTGARPERLRN